MSKKETQADRLLRFLEDGQWKSTPQILEAVYGLDHKGIARIASRIADLRRKGYEIDSRRDELHGSIWHYRLAVLPPSKAAPLKAPPPRVEFVEIDGVRHARMILA